MGGETVVARRRIILTVMLVAVILFSLMAACGMSSKGMPIGLQIIGKALDEETIIRAAYTYEQSQDYHKQMPQLGGNK